MPAPLPATLPQFLAATAARVPDQLAIDIPPGPGHPQRQTMRYGDLAGAVDRLARALLPRIGAERIVVIALPRSTPLLYVAQLAVLRAGAAFACLDPAFPPERRRELLADAAPALVLADGAGLAELAALCPHGTPVLDPAALLARAAPRLALPVIAPEQLAYVIYTSGTSGQPKGVLIEHRQIANLVASDLAEFALTTADRVVQGSSVAYDSSIEEMWLAFAAGATLLVMDDAAARLGPDLIGWLRDEGATVFCPPPTLLRATGCDDPRAALPALRLLYVGGEALPADIAARWGAGRRLVNGYGPTECAVTCLRGDIVPGAAITIGRPVPGMAAWVLDADLNAVPDGTPGELCIGGAGVARGYRHSPDLTAAKFIDHPRLGRLYRSGDLASRADDGNFSYHGRIDAQVKLRGYRIELGEIEARLALLPGVRAAAVRVQEGAGGDELVAFAVASDPAAPPDPVALRAGLAASLPAYMLPRQIALIARLPTSIGGKLDRAALPRLEPAPTPAAGPAPASPLEMLLASAWAEVLNLPAVPVTADFFTELGGTSLSAAMAVTRLRAAPEAAWVTVADLYQARSLRALALRAPAQPAPQPTHCATPPREGAPRPVLANMVQLSWLWLELVAGGGGAWLVAGHAGPQLFDGLGLAGFVLLAPLLGLAGLAVYLPLRVGFALLVKWLVIGRYRPMRTAVWSSYYLRHWVVVQAVRLIPWPLLAGTMLQIWVLRALGARIGARVHIHRGVDLRRGGWDLLVIGDDAMLEQDAHLGLVELDSGDLVIGPVAIGAGATLQIRAGVEGHCTLGAGSVLAPLSVLNHGGAIPPGELWDGVPAQRIGAAPPPPVLTQAQRQWAPWQHGLLLLGAEALVTFIAALPAEALTLIACHGAGLGSAGVWRWLAHPVLTPRLIATMLAITLAALPLWLVSSALLTRAMGRVRAGTISRWSAGYIRVWIKSGLLFGAGEWLSGTLFWPHWLRLAGMAVGPDCEISTIIDVVPELVAIGGESFFADGIYLGGARLRAGTVTLAPVRLGCNTFLGNHAVIRAGATLPENILIGVSTVADPRAIRAGEARFGHPDFDLPRRDVVAADRRLTHDPSTLRYANRLFWEGLRFVLPVLPLVMSMVWFALLTALAPRVAPMMLVLVVIPMAGLVPIVGLCGSVLALKWLLLGRVRPGQHALWSCWCSRWDFVYVAWAKWAALILQQLEGTFVLIAYLRMMGLKIGRGAVLGPQFAQVVDPDMIAIGPGATVTAMFQAHTFEDRVLKVGRVRIGAGATLAAGTVPLYGADIGEGAWVGPHSVIMKHEFLRPHTAYQGVPVRVLAQTKPSVVPSVDPA